MAALAERLAELIEKSAGFDREASHIQADVPSQASDESVDRLRKQYQDWYFPCLALLPEKYETKFRKQYEGGAFTPKIKQFIGDPRKQNVLYRPDLHPTNASSVGFFQFPISRCFIQPLEEQRQILEEYRQVVLVQEQVNPRGAVPGTHLATLDSPPSVFIGHGRSPLYLNVRNHLRDRLHLDVEIFEGNTRTAQQILEVLDQMLGGPAVAIIVMTGEDQTSDGQFRARQNVIHELGLAQGRLGFENVAPLVQSGVEWLSNLDGFQYIKFHEDQIHATFPELERWLESRGVLMPRSRQRSTN